MGKKKDQIKELQSELEAERAQNEKLTEIIRRTRKWYTEQPKSLIGELRDVLWPENDPIVGDVFGYDDLKDPPNLGSMSTKNVAAAVDLFFGRLARLAAARDDFQEALCRLAGEAHDQLTERLLAP